jgi:hypothetical protein
MWFGQSPSAAQEWGGPLPSIPVADALLDERRELTEPGYNPPRQFSQFPMRITGQQLTLA